MLSWEAAIHKMTGQAAARFGLPDRGGLRPGAVAGVVVFGPRTVDDLATYQALHRYPAGIRWVWVNGGAVLEAGRFHARPPGRVLAPAPVRDHSNPHQSGTSQASRGPPFP